MRGKQLFVIILGMLLMHSQRMLSQPMDTLQNFHPKYLMCKLTSPIFIAYFEKVPAKYLRTAMKKADVTRRQLLSMTGEATYQHFQRNANSDNLFLINSSSDVAMIRLNILYKERYPFYISVRYN